MKTRIGAAVLATLLAVAADARGPEIDALKSYAMPAYTIVTHEERSAQEVPPHVAIMDGLLSGLLKRRSRAVEVPTVIFVMPDNLWVDFLQPGTGISGEFVPGRFVNYVLISNSRDLATLRRTVYHEYAHLFLHTQLRGIIPLWFDEGMAKFAELAEFRGSQALIGKWPALNYGWLPLDRLLRLDKTSPEYRSSAYTAAVHGESWAIVHRAMVADPDFGEQMFALVDALNELVPLEEAVRSSFGMTLSQLSRAHYRYMWKSTFKTRWVDVDRPPLEKLADGRSMSEIESLALLADVMLVSGFKPERLAEVITSAQRRSPDSPGVGVLRMRLAARDQDDGALGRLLAEIEPHLGDPSVARGAGLALFERLNDRRRGYPAPTGQRIAFEQRAIELLDHSLMSRGDDPEAAWAFGLLAASTSRQLDSALQRLQSASERLPLNADLAMAMAKIYESRHQLDQMIFHLENVSRFARTPEQRLWARQRIEEASKK
jgi:hypothetical protein